MLEYLMNIGVSLRRKLLCYRPEFSSFPVICCNNLVLPKEWPYTLLTIVLILTATVCQVIFVNNLIGENSFLIDIPYILCLFLSLVFLLITSFTDPGILLPIYSEVNRDDEATRLLSEEVSVDYVTLVNGVEVVCMKCTTCNI